MQDTQRDDGPSVEVADEVVDAVNHAEVALVDPLKRIQAGVQALQKEGAEAQWDIDTTAGEAAAREFRRRCVSVRTAADKAYERGNAPLLAAQRQARQLRDDIKTEVEKAEQPWDKAIRDKEARKERERAEREQREREILLAIRGRISAFGAAVAQGAAAASSEAIRAILAPVAEQGVTEELFGEFVGEATLARQQALDSLHAMLNAAIAREEEAARIAKEREELERLRREQEERERQEKLLREQAEQADQLVAWASNVVAEAMAMTDPDAIAASLQLLDQTKAKNATPLGAHAPRVSQAILSAYERVSGLLDSARRRRAAELEMERARQQQEAAAAELRRQQDAFEAERKAAEQRAEEERQRVEREREEQLAAIQAQEALRRAQQAAAPAPVAEPTKAEPRVELPDEPFDLAPPLGARSRPSDEEILAALAFHFEVTEAEALAWIATFNVAAATLEHA